jgi:hypothetical protein
MKKENVCGFKTLILYYDTNLKFQTSVQQSLDPQQSADHRLINTDLFHTWDSCISELRTDSRWVGWLQSLMALDSG